MPWNVAIHTIDVGQGESSLIRAQFIDGFGAVAEQRTVLIDGGLYNQGPVVDNYLNGLVVGNLDVMVCTHYDQDHMRGLRWLLERHLHCGPATRLYDRGVQGVYVVAHGYGEIMNITDDYLRYVDAAGPANANVNRVTAGVTPAPGGNPQNWLVGQELLWNGVAPLHPNAPTLTCVACNGYLQGDPGRQHLSGIRFDLENEYSVGFVLSFNNFRFFTAGDLESTQEDLLVAGAHPAVGVMSAFKASHHGSNRSTSRAFLAAIQPRLCTISCGDNNGFGHPGYRVIADLNASAHVRLNCLTSPGGPAERGDIPAAHDPYTQLWGGNKIMVGGREAIPVPPAPPMPPFPAISGYNIIHLTETESQILPPAVLPVFHATFFDWDAPNPLGIPPGIPVGNDLVANL